MLFLLLLIVFGISKTKDVPQPVDLCDNYPGDFEGTWLEYEDSASDYSYKCKWGIKTMNLEYGEMITLQVRNTSEIISGCDWHNYDFSGRCDNGTLSLKGTINLNGQVLDNTIVLYGSLSFVEYDLSLTKSNP